ncbi:flavin reductase family protein [Novosphingobium sp. NPDC080210]|uniref:flavin reductase family protein n=1 Tax=Novosphingobium sp. NPDC080210 TaxID=3390596 RepID=UPI003D019656
MTSQDFRAAMRRLPAGVSVITTVDGTAPVGMTVTSVSSLSADPPSLLVCVNQSGSMHAALQEASHFTVNILASDHMETARQFADPALRDQRFSGDDWQMDEAGVPYFAPAQASFVCRLAEKVHFGTHTICIGEVERIRSAENDGPLIYFDGAYRELQ